MVKTKKVRSTKYKNKKTQRVYNKKHFLSGDGMLTTVWGPSTVHYLHTVSFNYPVKPTTKDKINYKNLILNMQILYLVGIENLKITLKHIRCNNVI